MKYRHEIAEDAIKALTPQATDTDIATALANYFLATIIPRETFEFWINHNAKAAKCPIRIDKPGVKKSSITIRYESEARVWLVEALLRRYEVTGHTYKGIETRSVACTKSQIEYAQKMAEYRANRAANPELDDSEIPF